MTSSDLDCSCPRWSRNDAPDPVVGEIWTPECSSAELADDVLISGVAGFDFDEDARELYVADTEFINKRILVFVAYLNGLNK